jgi:hypothetical protein
MALNCRRQWFEGEREGWVVGGMVCVEEEKAVKIEILVYAALNY